MKKIISWLSMVCIISTIFVCNASASTIQSSVSLNITIPSSGQTTIASGRDFYVIGDINGTLPDNAVMTVSLYQDGSNNPIRKVHTNIKDNENGMNINYSKLSYYGGSDRTPLKKSCMPDLVYDPSNPDSFKDAWRKCYYNDTNFTALISGGEYSSDFNLVGEDGVPYQPLKDGDYTILATAQNSDGSTIATTKKEIEIGDNKDVAIFRFSPADHYQKVIDEVNKNNYFALLDPLAGYWSPQNYIHSLSESSLFCEILPKWRFNDSREYQTSRSHFYVYNVSNTAATYTVELGTLQYQQVINDPNRLLCYYYDIGEPSLPNVNISSKFVQFQPGSHLAFTRADYPTGTSEDNQLVTNDLKNMKSDLNLTDGVNGDAGKTISFYGVVTPIQNAPSEITANDDNTYTYANGIKTLKYTITGDGVNTTLTKNVGLTRVINGKNYYSVFEFKNDITLDASWVGKDLKIAVQGYDAHGQPVNGTSQCLEVHVAEPNSSALRPAA